MINKWCNNQITLPNYTTKWNSFLEKIFMSIDVAFTFCGKMVKEYCKSSVTWNKYKRLRGENVKNIILLAGLITLLSLSGSAFAATAKCKVVGVKNNNVQLQCSQIVGEIKKGDTVKVKTQG